LIIPGGPIPVLFQQADEGMRDGARHLAQALGASSEADQEPVVREALARMMRVAERYVDSRDDAWDCAQEALILAVRRFDQFEGRANVNSWLHRIAVNCALAHIRKRGSKAEVPIDDLLPSFDDDGFQTNPISVSEASAEEIMLRDDARRQVHDSIRALPDNHRTVLIMRDIEEMSVSEIAETLSVTENAAKVRVHRARSALRRHLEPLLAEGRL
jgi:RNA polymerase sigma-70 factor (ECF subfamily)